MGEEAEGGRVLTEEGAATWRSRRQEEQPVPQQRSNCWLGHVCGYDTAALGSTATPSMSSAAHGPGVALRGLPAA
jgi:hypothetical protein